MANSFMADIGALGAASITAKKSTSREGNTEMKMEDFLTLMVVQLQNQTIDDTADTGEMLNQLVQMQMVTALSNMTDASVMSYASSLVGKEVTIGYVDENNKLHEEVLEVIGTGVYDGQQVIFCEDGKMYQLSQIMAVGRLPEEEKTDGGDEGENTPPTIAPPDPSDSSNTGNTNEDGDKIGEIDGSGESENDYTDPETGMTDPLKGGLLDGMLVNPNPADEGYDGTQGAPADEL